MERVKKWFLEAFFSSIKKSLTFQDFRWIEEKFYFHRSSRSIKTQFYFPAKEKIERDENPRVLIFNGIRFIQAWLTLYWFHQKLYIFSIHRNKCWAVFSLIRSLLSTLYFFLEEEKREEERRRSRKERKRELQWRAIPEVNYVTSEFLLILIANINWMLH